MPFVSANQNSVVLLMIKVLNIYIETIIPFELSPVMRSWRQCGRVVRALALRSGDPGFKTRSDHSLNLILVVPGSTSPAALVNSQLVCLRPVGILNSCCCCVLLFRWLFHWPWKAPMGSGQLSMYCIVLYEIRTAYRQLGASCQFTMSSDTRSYNCTFQNRVFHCCNFE